MNQRPTTLRPGDTVISLRYLSVQCPLITGCITAGILLYRAGLSSLQIVAGVALAALGGIAIGWIFSRTYFPARPGHVFVVRRESSALPLTLRAALIPSVVLGASAAATMALLGLSPLRAGLLVATGVATLVGCLIGSASALVR
jgi:hypothetical protein